MSHILPFHHLYNQQIMKMTVLCRSLNDLSLISYHLKQPCVQMSHTRAPGFSLTASVSGQLECTVGVQEEWKSLHVQTEKANVPSAELFLFLKKTVVFSPQYIMLIPINASSDMELHTLYAVSHPWLQMTLWLCVFDSVTIHFEYSMKKNICSVNGEQHAMMCTPSACNRSDSHQSGTSCG